MRVFALIAAIILGGSAESAETHNFKLIVAGFSAATLQLSVTSENATFMAEGRLRSTGVVRALTRLTYDGRSAGKITGGRLVPHTYREKARVGQRATRVEMTYKDGRPSVMRYESTQAEPTDAITARKGRLDILTASAMLLSDRDRADICAHDYRMFDGARSTALRAQSQGKSGDMITCSGTYLRQSGFTKGELARGDSFDFTLFYRAIGSDRFQLVEIVTDSTAGKVRLRRE